MRILFLGDVFGRPGRHAISNFLPRYRAEHAPDCVIANGENAAGGKGITRDICEELFDYGIDILTGGNHSFAQRESLDLFDREPRLLRPANYAPGVPGRGLGFTDTASGERVAVINLQGRAFMSPVDCPFRAANRLVDEAREQTSIIIVDFHAEATSETIALTHYLAKQVTAVIGTHTHVPTADARVSAGGTAAITDVGMCGPFDGVIGVETEIVIEQLVRGMPVRHRPAHGDARVCGLLVECDDNGRARAVEQIIHPAFPLKAPGGG